MLRPSHCDTLLDLPSSKLKATRGIKLEAGLGKTKFRVLIEIGRLTLRVPLYPSTRDRSQTHLVIGLIDASLGT